MGVFFVAAVFYDFANNPQYVMARASMVQERARRSLKESDRLDKEVGDNLSRAWNSLQQLKAEYRDRQFQNNSKP